ncbi:exosortase U [Rosistilla oblonga]|uniref:exosortase U n=1 Tax=Rosistilla oblonga TaxID=2527990 RepID=UPI003A979569
MNQIAETVDLPTQLAKFARAYRFELLILICFTPLALLHFRNLWRHDHYQYFPLILLVFPYLLWTSQQPGLPSSTSQRWEQGFTLTSLLLLAAALFLWSPNIAMMGAVFAAGSILLAMRRTGKIARFMPLWIVLWFLVRMPANLDTSLMLALQSWTSRAASLLLDALRIDHALLGNVIWAGPQNYFVEEACSGINSLFSLTALVAVALVLSPRPLVHAVLLIFAAAFWASVVNILRVALLVLFNERFQINLLEGTPHTIFGLLLFGFAGAMLVATDQFLMVFHQSEHIVDLDATKRQANGLQLNASPLNNERSHPTPDRTPPLVGEHRFAAIASPLFIVLLLGQFYSLVAGAGYAERQSLPQSNVTFVATDLPLAIDGWEQSGFEVQKRDAQNFFGEHSAIWTYRRNNYEVFVSIDYPFRHWHELIICYENQGKELASRKVLPSDNELPPIVYAELASPSGHTSLLAFCLFRRSGAAMQPPPEAKGLVSYLHSRFGRILDAGESSHEPTYQVQVLAPILDESDRLSDQSIIDLHQQVTRTLRSLVAAKTGDR